MSNKSWYPEIPFFVKNSYEKIGVLVLTYYYFERFAKFEMTISPPTQHLRTVFGYDERFALYFIKHQVRGWCVGGHFKCSKSYEREYQKNYAYFFLFCFFAKFLSFWKIYFSKKNDQFFVEKWGPGKIFQNFFVLKEEFTKIVKKR